jgi:ATP-dependent Lon protease
MKGKIESAAQEEMSDAQRQYYLRQQLKAIQDELGEGEKPEAQELRKRVQEAKLPEAVAITLNKEIDRLERMTPQSPEYQMLRTYVDWVLDVPWSVTTEDRLDPAEARAVLDADHYDLDKVKERIVEYLAVQKLKRQQTGALAMKGSDPVLRRAARRRQDVARPVDRARHEPQVRAHSRSAACATRPKSAVTGGPTSDRSRDASCRR